MIFILYPHQLFKDIELLKGKKVLLIEEPLFFTQYNFHIQKLILHRASMQFYKDYLKTNSLNVEYFEDESYIDKYKNTKIYMYDVVDDFLSKKIIKNFKDITIYKNPNFLNVNDQNKFMHNYYINRRKELNILVDENKKPIGAKWSFDSENRKKLPKNKKAPLCLEFQNRYIDEAKEYCKKFNTIGEAKSFYYPITFDEAKINLEYFLGEKFECFGEYQDAIVQNASFLYHSNISSSLNIGLLSLDEVLNCILKSQVPLNSKEGFIRQIIGWREFMLSTYKSSHVKLRTSNFFGFKNRLPKKLLAGDSGLRVVDDVIKKLNTSAYNHHIERLMILGNIFLLLRIDPNEVYEFFMRNYIDAYDWVMVGNVYGMSGFSDGGSITTKPYISSSNYILKMSEDYKKSEPWCKIWDGLYWSFLDEYKNYFENSTRMKMQLSLLNKMEKEKLQTHKDIAKRFLKELYI